MEKFPKIFKNWRGFINEGRQDLEELVDPQSIDLSSFVMQPALNEKVWDENKQLRPEVHERLMIIAQDFMSELELLSIKVYDITITGSLANYNWSRYSDVDLHILVDFNEISENRELVEEWLISKRVQWNKNHTIMIYGFEVEIYMQDVNEEHASTGVYSVLRNEWNIEPVKENPVIDWSSVRFKAAALMEMVDAIEESYKAGEFEETMKTVDIVKERIRRLRSCGLEKAGAFSVENLAFKVLRRNGYLKKLGNYKLMAYDKSLSLNGAYTTGEQNGKQDIDPARPGK